MRFALGICLALAASSAFAKTKSRDLHCTFIDGSSLSGAIVDGDKLRVDTYDGFGGETRDLNDEDSGEALNENPIAAGVARDGRTKYLLDDISQDGDYGDTCTLYLPSTVKTGKMKSSYACERYSRGPDGESYTDGTCTLK